MFTIGQIHEAFAKVKSGSDFPTFVQDLKKIGITHYDNFVSDGRTIYYGQDEFLLNVDAKYPEIQVSKVGSPEDLKQAIQIHQQGQTDYPTFCTQAADAGVHKWTTDTIKMTVTYLDITERALVVEPIPVS
ncbi:MULTISPECIES: DUF1398 domain-containing protein [unclassified Flagellimonas]|uniref:DUF1398 family protein n=1 Tax=Flagellimonas sp. MMG031 TaxID=3158549 RepID=A0AAU7MU70_9FLAO